MCAIPFFLEIDDRLDANGREIPEADVLRLAAPEYLVVDDVEIRHAFDVDIRKSQRGKQDTRTKAARQGERVVHVDLTEGQYKL